MAKFNSIIKFSKPVYKYTISALAILSCSVFQSYAQDLIREPVTLSQKTLIQQGNSYKYLDTLNIYPNESTTLGGGGAAGIMFIRDPDIKYLYTIETEVMSHLHGQPGGSAAAGINPGGGGAGLYVNGTGSSLFIINRGTIAGGPPGKGGSYLGAQPGKSGVGGAKGGISHTSPAEGGPAIVGSNLTIQNHDSGSLHIGRPDDEDEDEYASKNPNALKIHFIDGQNTLHIKSMVEALPALGGGTNDTLILEADPYAGNNHELQPISFSLDGARDFENLVLEGGKWQFNITQTPPPHIFLHAGEILLIQEEDGDSYAFKSSSIVVDSLEKNIKVGSIQQALKITSPIEIKSGNFTVSASKNDLRQDLDLRFYGPIYGLGGIKTTGEGRIILLNDNTYSGGTFIEPKSALQIGTQNDIPKGKGSVIGDVVNNGNFLFYNTNNYDFPGLISGNGSVSQRGPNILTFTNNQTYTGSTDIYTNSSLMLGNAGNSGWISGGVINDGTLIFYRSNNCEFLNRIVGFGSVVQKGSGKLILNGLHSYTGKTQVLEGELYVKKSIASSSEVDVVKGILSGIADLPKTVIQDSGIHIPGHDDGRGNQTVRGDYSINGELRVSINPDGTNDILIIENGSIFIADQAELNLLTGSAVSSEWNRSEYYFTIIKNNKNNPVAGNFQSIVLPYFIRSAYVAEVTNKVIATPLASGTPASNDVALHLVRRDVPETTTTPTPPTSTSTLPPSTIPTSPPSTTSTPPPSPSTSTPPPSTSTLPPSTLPPSTIPTPPTETPTPPPTGETPFSFEQTINGVVDPGTIRGGNALSVAQSLDLLPDNTPIRNLLKTETDPEKLANLLSSVSGDIHLSTRSALISDSFRISSSIGMTDRRDCKQCYSVWAHGVFSKGQDEEIHNFLGSLSTSKTSLIETEVSSKNILVGADWQTDNALAGVFAGYGRLTLATKPEYTSSAESKNYHIGAYSTFFFKNMALRVKATHSHHDISTTRGVLPPISSSILSANYKGKTLQFFAEGSLRTSIKNINLEPFLGLSYFSNKVDKYIESGGFLSLSGAGDPMSGVFTTLGLRAFKNVELSKGNLMFRFGSGLKHALGDLQPSAVHSIQELKATLVKGLPLVKDVALLEAGINFLPNDLANIGILWRGEFGKKSSNNSFDLDLKLAF